MEDQENILKMLEDTKPLLETWMHNEPDGVGLRFPASSSHNSMTTENYVTESVTLECHSTGHSEGSNGEIEENHLDVNRTENEICFVDLQANYTFECSSIATDNIQGISGFVDPLRIDSTAECETSLNRSNADFLKATERANLPDKCSFEASPNVSYVDRQSALNVVLAACENDLHSLTVKETGSNVVVDESEDAIEILAMSLNQTIDVEKLVIVEFDESPEISNASFSDSLEVVDNTVDHSLISNAPGENNHAFLSAPLQVVDKIVNHSLISNDLIEKNDGSVSASLEVTANTVDHSLILNALVENNYASLSAPLQVADQIVGHSLISNNLIENNDGSVSARLEVADNTVDPSLVSNAQVENNYAALGAPLQVADHIVDHSLISNNLIEKNDDSVSASLEVLDNTLYHSLISNDLIENNDASLSAPAVISDAVDHSLISNGLLENNDASDTDSKNIVEQLINKRNTLYNEVSMLHIRAEKVRKNIAQTDESILAQVLEIEANEEKLKKYRNILKDYELLPCIQDKDEAMVMQQSKALQKRLSEAEIRLSFILQKYGKIQSLFDSLRRNEEISQTNKKNLESQLLDLQNKCQTIEDKFKSSKMCQERHEQEKEKYKKLISKQEALIKILKIKALSLETAIEQKSQECKAIAALCEVPE